MNHDKARQRAADGRWDYTSATRGGVHALGYCSGWSDPREWTFGGISPEEREREYNRVAPFRDKYHTDGHATPEEARACYKEYLLDQGMRCHNGPADPATLYRCEADGCGEMTAGTVDVGWGVPQSWHLCPDHQDRSTVEALVVVGESWHS